MRYDLPDAVKAVAEARNKLRAQYRHHKLKNDKYLEFTPDGKFVGDLGEAIAAELFDLELDPGKHIDGFTRCEARRPVQIKATGRLKGTFQFRKSDYADHKKVHLIAIRIDWDDCKYEIVYNGPESDVRPKWKDAEFRAKDVTVSKMIAAQNAVDDSLKLMVVNAPTKQWDH